MTSVTLQNFSSVASQADVTSSQRATANQRLANPAPTSQDVQQIRQISSDSSSTKAKVDKEREPSTPKKPDAGFAAKEDKEDYQFQRNLQTKNESEDKPKRLEVVA